MSFDLLETLQRVLRNELSRSQILDESKRLRLLQRDSQDFSTVKYVLQIGLLEEIMKSENLTNREYYASLLQSSLERLNLKSRREQGYRCFLSGCFFSGRRHREYINHLVKAHSNREKFTCNFKMECKRIFRSVDDLEDHVKTHHCNQAASQVLAIGYSAMFISCKCTLISCGQKQFESIRELVAHINNDHKMQPRGCIFRDCPQIFKAGSVSRNHFLLKHLKCNQVTLKNNHIVQNRSGKEYTNNGFCDVTMDSHVTNDQNLNIEAVTVSTDDRDLDFNEEYVMEIDVEEDCENDELLFKMDFCDFLNRLVNEKYLPMSTVNSIAREYLSLAIKAQKRIKRVLQSSLERNASFDLNMTETIIHDVLDEDPFVKAQEELLTEYKRHQFISSHFKLINPVEIILNPNDVRYGAKKECYHYVPIQESFRVLVEDKSFNNALECQRNEPPHNSHTFKDVKDGNEFRESDYFIKNPEAYALLLYSDAVELTNPLGAGRLKHKVVQVFWCILDIPKHHRSQIDKLQLGLVFKEKLLKKYSLEQILRPFVNDLKVLEQTGIHISHPFERIVKAGLLAYAADNLEAHVVGGFSTCFSSRDVCRFCHCTYQDLSNRIHNFTKSGSHSPWTRTEYDKITEAFDHNPVSEENLVSIDPEDLFNEVEEPILSSDSSSSNESDSEESSGVNYGLRSRCVFNELEAFHCVTSMPPDCLHDLFEGVLAQDLLGIIRVFHQKLWFSVKDYNKVLKRFPLSPQESSNRPQEVPLNSSVKKLNGKAVSIWCHMRLFMLVLYLNNWIKDENDEVLKLAILLSDITLRVTAEEFQEYEIDRLEELVIQYLDLREELCSRYPVLGTAKPKHHNLTHYGASIRKFGPPMCYWTGRFESKHRVSKSLAESGKNFINVSLTISTRQQFRLASTFFRGMFPDDLSLPVKVKTVSELGHEGLDRQFRSFAHYDDLVCEEVTWKSRQYKVGVMVVISRFDQILMDVGEIRLILIRNNEVHLILRRSKIEQNFVTIFKSIEISNQLSVVKLRDLQDTYPLFKRGNESNFCLIPHHHVSFLYD